MAATIAVNALEFSSVWCFFAAVMSIGLFAHCLTARWNNRATFDLAV
jgi:hypothetical protein